MPINTKEDSDIEPNETFTLTISSPAGSDSIGSACNQNPSHYSLGSTTTATGTIRNDDTSEDSLSELQLYTGSFVAAGTPIPSDQIVPLTPTFSAGTLDYDASVPSDFTGAVRVRATPSDSTSTTRIDVDWVTSGSLTGVTGAIQLDPEAGITTIRVVVIPEDTTVPPQTYTISLKKGIDYDSDDNGLIDIDSLAKLNAIRYDLDGDGAPDNAADKAAYETGFPVPDSDHQCSPNTCAGYELTGDLDFDTSGNGSVDSSDAFWNSGAGWDPIGKTNAEYDAVFDGDGNTISHLFIDRTSAEQGLFGATGDDAQIRNIGLENVDVSSSGRRVGGLVGRNRGGTIIASYTTGKVVGDNRVGGLAGENTVSDSAVAASYSTASATGSEDVGGLVGGALQRRDTRQLRHRRGDRHRRHHRQRRRAGGRDGQGQRRRHRQLRRRQRDRQRRRQQLRWAAGEPAAERPRHLQQRRG